jgi:hypothetical protein
VDVIELSALFACVACGMPAKWNALTEDGYADVCESHLPVPVSYPVTDSCQGANDAPVRRTVCDASLCDGNRDDPSFAYCGLPYAHAGGHDYRL